MRPRLPLELTQLLDQGFIVVGDCIDSTPNAYVKDFGSAGYAIVFNIGLVHFLYRIARVIGTRFNFIGTEERATQDISDTARIIAEILWWHEQTGQAFGPDYEISDDQIYMASALCTEAETFLLAHEIGHIVSDMSESPHPMLARIQRACSEKHYQEYSADAYGLAITMEFGKEWTRITPHDYLRYAGIEFSLQTIQVFEHMGFMTSEAHPKAEDRLKFVRSLMQEKFPDQQVWEYLSCLSSSIEKLFSRITGIINDPGAHSAIYEHQAEMILIQINDLIDRCTQEFIPNYIVFYEEINSILSKGYCHKVLERVAELVSDFAKFANVNSPINVVTDEIRYSHWRSLQRFKILLGYAMSGYAPAPVEIVFKRVLGVRGYL